MWRLAIILLGLVVVLASCDKLGLGKVSPDEEVKKQLNALQISIEKELAEGAKAKTTILAVVDTQRLAKPAEGEEPDPALLQAAEKRERDVRQGMNAVLVENVLLEVVQPAEEQIGKARAAIAAANSPALDKAVCEELGKATAADYLICALIDDSGKKIDVTVQRSKDGVVVYQETLKEWSVAVPQEKAGAAPAE